jgi:ABC-type glycerol-3-phosphate transport system substrate-binding protein
VLAACAAPGTPPPPAQDAREVTISYVTDWNAGGRGEYVKNVVPKFTEEHPKIRVQVDNWAGEVNTTAIANAAAGTLQDVMLAGGDLFIQLARDGQMKDLTPHLKAMKFNMDDLVHFKSSLTYQGKQYGMPFQPNISVLVINKTMFQNANADLPTDKTTYQQLLDSLRRVAKPDENICGMETRYGLAQWVHYIWAWGGDVLSADLKRTTIDQPAAIEGLQFMFDMIHRHRVGTPIDANNALPAGVNRNNGNLAIGYTSSPIRNFGASLRDRFELDFMYHPVGPKTGKRAVHVSDQPNIVTGMANKRVVFDQAVQFVVWLASSKTAQQSMAENGPEVPVLKSMLNSPAYQTPPPASMKVVFDEIPSFRETPIFLGQQEWMLAVRAALIPAFLGQKSTQDAAKEAARAGDVVLARLPR